MNAILLLLFHRGSLTTNLKSCLLSTGFRSLNQTTRIFILYRMRNRDTTVSRTIFSTQAQSLTAIPIMAKEQKRRPRRKKPLLLHLKQKLLLETDKLHLLMGKVQLLLLTEKLLVGMTVETMAGYHLQAAVKERTQALNAQPPVLGLMMKNVSSSKL